MSTAIFPVTLPGIEWDIKRAPLWSTLVQQAASGYTVRIGEYPFPQYRWTLSIAILDASAAIHSFQDFFGFLNGLLGRTLPFLFKDDYDYTVTGQAIGTGDGVTTVFQMSRTLGGFNEPVFAPKSGTVTVKVAGVTTAATINYDTGQITFGSAPAGSAAITADFEYYWRCYLDKDDNEFNSFDYQGLEMRELSFTSCRA